MKKPVMIICGVLLNFVLLTNINYAHESTEYLFIIDDSGNKARVEQFTTAVFKSGGSQSNIKFSIPVNGSNKLKIYNIIGEQVAQLLNEEMNPGYREDQFDVCHFSSGIYLYSLVGKNVNITGK